MDMKTKYTVKGLGTEQTITSKIKIYTENGKITQVQDKWDGKIPEGVFATVSIFSLVNPFWWTKLGIAVAWWAFCGVAWTSRIWLVGVRFAISSIFRILLFDIALESSKVID